MRRSHYIILALAVARFSAQPSYAVNSPEYIAAETLAGTPPDQTRSPTSNIGRPPDMLHALMTPWIAQGLQRWRAKAPRTGIAFIDESVITAAPRFFYRYRNDQGGSISEAFTGGGALAFKSGWAADFLRIGLAGYLSQRIHGPGDRDGTGLLAPDQQSYAVLGQAFADVKFGRSYATIGRALIDLPYMNANDGRMTPNTFEYVGIRTTEFKDFQLGLGHVLKIKPRNRSTFEYMSERAGAPESNKGVSAAGIRWNVTDKYFLSAVEEYGWDTFNIFYVESERVMSLGEDFILKLGGQFTDQRSVGDELLGDFQTQHLGVKAELGHGPVAAFTSFTWTARGSDIFKPWGGSPSYNSVMISDFDRAGEKAVRVGLSCDFTKLGLNGLSAAGYFVHGDTADSQPTQQEVGVTVDYRLLEGRLKNLWLRGRAAWNDGGNGDVVEDYRLILNYSVAF